MAKQEDLQVITKAKALVKHTFVLTSNLNRYPKKYRYSLVPRIQDVSMDIYENLMEANRTNVNSDKVHRLQLQTDAVTSCDKLMNYIDLSLDLDLLSYKSADYWSKMVSDIKHMTLAWRTKDRTR